MTGVELLSSMEEMAEPVPLPTRLFQMMQFFNVELELEMLRMPPPPETALFPEKTQLTSVGLDAELYNPPPYESDELPEKTQLVKLALLEALLYIPPPFRVAELPKNAQLLNVGLETRL